MAEKEKKLTAKEIRKATQELDSLLEKPELFDILSEMTDDRKLFAKASSNPVEFLEKRGMKIPSELELTLEQKTLALRAKGTFTLCFIVCRRVRGYVICRSLCISITITIG